MEIITEGFLQTVAETASLEELEALTTSSMFELGFHSFILRQRNSVQAFGLFNHEFLFEYRQRGLDRVDPVARQVDSGWVPVMWDAIDYPPSQRDCDELWHRSREVGYERGISVPVNGPLGQRYAFVGIYSGDMAAFRASRYALSSNLMILGAYVAQAHHRITTGYGSMTSPLTRRENQCLRWTCKGKTAWEVANIIGISERTANFHLQNAMAKLESPSKHSACLKALSLGLIVA